MNVAARTNRRAQLFLDEAGRFSTPDDMRIVGGLLVIADPGCDAELAQIHDRAAAAIGWPVRLHAFELVQDISYLAFWHRAAATGHASFLTPAESRTMGAWAARWRSPTPLVHDRDWGGKPTELPGLSRDAGLESAVRLIGMTMFHRVRDSLRRSFESWCNEHRRAYVVAGHVDDTVAPGQRAYDLALGEALVTASRVAETHDVRELDVHVARWSDSRRHTPADVARAALGDRAIVTVSDYGRAGDGVWLADALLAWLRGAPRRAEGTLLTDVVGGQACVRASSTARLPEARPPRHRYTTFDHFVAAVHRTTEFLGSGRVP